MKRIIFLLLTFAAFTSQAQDTVKVYQGVPTTMAGRLYQFKSLKVDSTSWFQKAVRFDDSVSFGKKVYLPMAPLGDSSNEAASTGWVKRNVTGGSGSGTSGLPCSAYEYGQYVTWSGIGLTYDVSASGYCIGGTLYRSASGTTTLSTADATYPRFDRIVLDTNLNIVNITGTPGVNPAVPTHNPASQYSLTIIYIPAGATTPPGAVQRVLWNENTGAPEWTASTSGTITADFNSTGTPYKGTKATLVSSANNGSSVIYSTAGSGYVKANHNTLKFFVRLTAAMAAKNDLQVQLLLDNGSFFTEYITLNNTHGFLKSVVGTYQNISVSLASFVNQGVVNGNQGLNITGVVISFIRNNADPLSIDYVTLEGGTSTPGTATTNAVTDLYRKAGTDSIFIVKNGLPYLAMKDSIGTGGGSADTTISKYPLFTIVTPGQKDTLAVDTSKIAGAVATFSDVQLQQQRLIDSAAALQVRLQAVNDTVTNHNTRLIGKASQTALRDTAAAIRADFPTGGGGSGTVTSVSPGYGTNFTTITTTGPVVVDSTVMASQTRLSNQLGTKADTATLVKFNFSGLRNYDWLKYDSVNQRWQNFRFNVGANLAYDYITNTLTYTGGSGSAGWGLNGNAATNPGVDFLGTTDDKNFIIKRNNVQSALIDSSSGIYGKTYFGYAAGRNNTDITLTAVGWKAATANTTGTGNTALGARALMANVTGTSNTIIGSNTAAAMTGNYSTIVGEGAARSVSGNGTTVIGQNAMGTVTGTGQGNTIGGAGSMYSGSGTFNTAWGHNVMANGAVTGTNNTGLGANSAYQLTSGTGNLHLGSNSGYPFNTESGLISLSTYQWATKAGFYSRALIFGEQSSTGTYHKLVNNARLGIYKYNPTAFLHLPTGNNEASTAPLKFSAPTSLTTTAATGNGSAATLTFATQPSYPFILGSTITVSGVTPSGYNGTFVITAVTETTVTYVNTTTGAQTVAGTITQGGVLTTPENGAIEYDGNEFYGTANGARYILTKTLIGTAAPATTPLAVGVHFVDAVNKKVYVSTGTASSADWTILN